MPKINAFQQYTKEYDDWFVQNHFAFLSELEAVKKVLTTTEKIIEVGIGSGIFALPLGITEGIDPSEAMRQKALEKGLVVKDATAESLPYDDVSINGIVMITSICFVDDIYQSFKEAHRILKNNGFIILGFVDKESPVGRDYLKHKNESLFYKEATFFGTFELYDILKKSGFSVSETYQTIFGKVNEVKEIQPIKEGFGEGSFVVIKAQKNQS